MRRLCVLLVVQMFTLFAHCEEAQENIVIHDKAVRIDGVCCLATNGLSSVDYLFNSTFWNEPEYRINGREYESRRRGFVDLNGDGKLDVIISMPMSYYARMGVGYYVYIWTNGLFKCVGEIWGAGRSIKVERHWEGCTIWGYSPCCSREGSFNQLEITNFSVRPGSVSVIWEGDQEPCIAYMMCQAIEKYANEPVRWEYSETKNGVTKWIPMSDKEPSLDELIQRALEFKQERGI